MSPNELVDELAVPEWLTVAAVLEDHTFLPLIRLFLNPSEVRRVSAVLAKGYKMHAVSILLADRERHCLECRKSEFATLGECGIQSLHQLHWITRCHKHECMLSDGRDLAAETFPNELLACVPNLSRPDVTLLNGVQKSTVWLAKMAPPALGRSKWRAFHRAALTSRFGIQPPYRRSELLKVAKLVSKRMTRLLRLPVYSSYINWVETVVHSRTGSINPLYHILLLRLCGETLASAVMKLQNQPARAVNDSDTERELQLRLPLLWRE